MYCIRSIVINLRQTQRKILPFQKVINVKQCTIIRNNSTGLVEDDSAAIIDELCNGDLELEKKLKILMLEVEVMRQDGRSAPTHLQTRHWKHLMELTSKNRRISYLTYLFKTEKSKENHKAKKAKRKEEKFYLPPKENPDDILYGIQYQSLFLRIRDKSINQFDNYRALQAMRYGQPIVIDCSYEDKMVNREILNAAKQLTFVYGDNRIHQDPFNIHLCNLNMEGAFMQQLQLNIPSIQESWFPLNMHTNSYMDLFPKNKLVYLTPHCREELTTYDHDAVYIIGCMVDKVNSEPLSLAKAKRDGIKMAKLPLERYLEWAPGSRKNLNINHMVPILLDLKSTGNWEFALQHIPRRKLMETKVKAMQNKLKNPKLREEVIRSYQNLNIKPWKPKSRRSLYFDDDKI